MIVRGLFIFWCLLQFLSFSFFCGTGVWTQGLNLKPLHQALWRIFFQDRVLQTVCLDGFETWSSWSLPPENIGVQAWATIAQLFFNFFLQGSIIFTVEVITKVRLILWYFLETIVNGIVFLTYFSTRSLLAYRKDDFLNLVILPKVLIRSRSFSFLFFFF
jgi:hypothetical protein